jgi:hypothetical protein
VHVPRGPRSLNQSGAGLANGAAPSVHLLAPATPGWRLAGPSAQMLGAVEVDPALEPPPPFWCRAHGWVVCPLHQYGHGTSPPPEGNDEGAALQPATAGLSPTSVFEFGGNSGASALDVDAIEAHPPSPTPMVVEVGTDAPLQMPPSEVCPPDAPRVQVREGDAHAFVLAPTGASSFSFGSGASNFSSAAKRGGVVRPLTRI